MATSSFNKKTLGLDTVEPAVTPPPSTNPETAFAKKPKLGSGNQNIQLTQAEAAFRQAEAKKTPVIGYFYEPQWLFSELKLVKVELPAYKAGCDDDPEKVACDYPVYALDKIVSK